MALDAHAFYTQTTKNPQSLHICADGLLSADLQKHDENLGIASCTVSHGFLQTAEVARVLSSTLALILPSSEEQFGQVVPEAQALGLPVIVSDNCRARDFLVRNGVNGFVIEPDNPQGLAFFMDLVANDEILWRRMVTCTAERAPLGDVATFVRGVRGLVDSA